MDKHNPQKYFVLNILTTGCALLIAFCLLVGHSIITARKNLLQDVTLQAHLVGSNVAVAVAAGDKELGEEMLATLEQSKVIEEAALYRFEGDKMSSYDRNGQADLPIKSPEMGHVFTGSTLNVTVPVHYNRTRVGTLSIRASLGRLYENLFEFVGGLLATAAVATLLGTLAGHGLRQRMAKAESELRLLALYDGVTGLANRHAFEMAVEQTLLRHQRDGGGSTLLFVDVDGFKKVNDRYGHAVGDKVLQQIGERITYTLRAADVVARLGGDEFGAILVNTSNPNDAASVADSLVKEAAKPFQIDNMTAHIGFSIGIAMIPADGESSESVMHHADLAMYHAKSLGKGNYQFFSNSLDDAVRHRLVIEEGLHTALKNDELFVVYQPQLETVGGHIQGLEALVRWRRSDGTIVSPAEFIPVAEESGMISEIGRTVMQKACFDIGSLRAEGYAVPIVAVNISGRQFMHRNLAKEMVELLDIAGLTVKDIEIELTESVLMDRLDEYKQIMHDLSASGIRIAIDDFGTGYSSLSYLNRLPVGKLKIDRSFVQDLPQSAESLAIVSSVVSMAHAIGLKVVAEGVETGEQATCLLDHGCDLLQGYYTGRPMTVDKLKEILPRRELST